MYVVYTGRERHSAWCSKKEAQKQKDILVGYGYKSIKIVFDEYMCTDDGHYFM